MTPEVDLARFARLEYLVELLHPGVAAAITTLSAPWTLIGSGVTPANGKLKFAVDTTAGGSTIDLSPMTVGQILIVNMRAGANPITIVAPAGVTIADPSSGGVQGAQAVLTEQGATAWWQLSGTTLLQLV